MTAESIFLIPNGTFFVEFIIFVLMLVAAWKWILPPVNAMLDRRQEKIRTALAAADEARAEAASSADERARLLAEARTQARDIVAGAQATSDQIKADSGARGQAEYDRIVAAAAAEVSAIRQRAINEASERINQVVFELVEKIVGREVDQRTHQALVADAVTALQSSGADAAVR